MNPILDEFEKIAGAAVFSEPKIDLISNVSGNFTVPGEITARILAGAYPETGAVCRLNYSSLMIKIFGFFHRNRPESSSSGWRAGVWRRLCELVASLVRET